MIDYKIEMDTREVRKLLNEYIPLVKDMPREVCNQWMYDVLVGAFKHLLPTNVQAARNRVKSYMWHKIAEPAERKIKSRIARVKTSLRRAGRKRIRRRLASVKASRKNTSDLFHRKTGGRPRTTPLTPARVAPPPSPRVPGKRGRKKKRLPLYRVHLIAQKKWREWGGSGLYGGEMKRAAGYIARRASSSIGYLKLPLFHVIRKMTPNVRHKVSWKTLGAGIARWTHTQQKGSIKLATQKIKTNAEASFTWNMPKQAEGEHYVAYALGKGMDLKIAKATRSIQRILDRRARKFPAKVI